MSPVLHALRHRTIEEVAAMFPASARILSAHGLCNERDRRISLEQAAARHRLALTEVLLAIGPHVDLPCDRHSKVG